MNGQDSESITSAEDAPPQTPLIRRPIYHGWWIALAGLAALAVVEFAGEILPDRLFHGTSTTNLLFVTIVAFVLVSLALLLLPPIVGHLADRYSPRFLAVPALLIGGLSAIALSRLEPGWVPFVAAILIGNGLSATIHIVMATAVANWFSRNRGKAFALLLMGPAVALFLSTLPIRLQIDLLTLTDDVSEALSGGTLMGFEALVAGIAMIAIAVPIVILLRHKPDGSNARLEQEGFTEHDPDTEPAQQPLSAILKSRQYLFYVVALSLQASAIGAIRITAGSALGDSITSIGVRWFGDTLLAAAVVVAVGLLVTGALSDRYDRRKVVAGILGAQLFCSLALVTAPGELAVLALAIAIGGGAGALSAANLALQAELWGRRRFGLLMGIQMSATMFLTIVWPLAMGAIWGISSLLPFELDDDAALFPFVIIGTAVPLAVALALILLMNRPRVRGAEAARAEAREA